MSALSKRQLDLRRDSIGGSEIAALAGLSRWASPVEIFEAKVSGTSKESTLAMRLGTALEDPVADIYAEQTGRWLRHVDTCRHPSKQFAIATPDRAVFPLPVAALAKAKLLKREQLAEAERLLEVKTTTWRLAEEWGTEGTDEIPEHHLCQVQWTLGVTGKQDADVVVLFDRDRLATYRVHFSSELFAGLLEIGERFLVDHVAKGVPPPPDASERYAEFLGRRFPEAKRPVAVMSAEQLALALDYSRAKAAEKRAEEAVKELGNALRAAIGEHEGLVMGPLKVSWVNVKGRTTTDWEGVAGEAIAMTERFLAGTADAQQVRAQLQTLIGRFTSQSAGHRALRMSKELQTVGTEFVAAQFPKQEKP